MKVNCKVPKTLRTWLDKHADRIIEVDYGSGYATDSGKAYDILMATGWHAYGDRVHTVIEPTAREALRELRHAFFDTDCKKICGGE